MRPRTRLLAVLVTSAGVPHLFTDRTSDAWVVEIACRRAGIALRASPRDPPPHIHGGELIRESPALELRLDSA
jgi:hypothetical protein